MISHSIIDTYYVTLLLSCTLYTLQELTFCMLRSHREQAVRTCSRTLIYILFVHATNCTLYALPVIHIPRLSNLSTPSSAPIKLYVQLESHICFSFALDSEAPILSFARFCFPYMVSGKYIQYIPMVQIKIKHVRNAHISIATTECVPCSSSSHNHNNINNRNMNL